MQSDNDDVKRPDSEEPVATDASASGEGPVAPEWATAEPAPIGEGGEAPHDPAAAPESASEAEAAPSLEDDPSYDPADGIDREGGERAETDSAEVAIAPEGEGEVPDVAEGGDGSGGGDSDAPSGDEAGEEGEGAQMTLLEHLGELRTRLVRAAIAVAVGMVACYGFAEQMFNVLMQPMVEVFQKKMEANPLLPQQFFTDFGRVLGDVMTQHGMTADKVDLFVSTLQKALLQATQEGHFQYTYPAEAFFAHIKVSIVAGLFLVSPYVFAQIWGFIAPGLYAHERKWMYPMALVSALFFTAGALFGYFVVFPYGFEFFASFSTEGIQFTPKLNEYLSFCLKLLFAFGLVFELPLFIFFLARLGMVSSAGLRKKRKYAILIAFVVAAILTPPDPFTQCLMAGPLIVLYELGIWVAFFFGKKEKRHEKKAEAEPTLEPGDSAGEAGKA
ncbi:MAG: twin-arginine translocase subunit TatC [Pseudodesulfovibrio sp.]